MLYDRLHNTLLIGPAHPATMLFSQVMARRLHIGPRQLSFVRPDDSWRRSRPGVVAADPPGNITEKLDRLDMTILGRLRALPVKSHHNKGPLAHLHLQLNQRMPNIRPSLPRPVQQRHKHLLPQSLHPPNHVFHFIAVHPFLSSGTTTQKHQHHNPQMPSSKGASFRVPYFSTAFYTKAINEYFWYRRKVSEGLT